ncbi:MAG: S1 RNA-binding domain-containing protein [Leptotrichiaceae bacterium]|nr:S1 RNA-binding domain-containing protein [Leptotrichiaceae bacterium]MBP7101281.1 S1 RNA-binding domain-containing protein [Leptotrichiaceae bacterium]MBP7739765.1 S1 RNA-binding domain-containing protein [Leptotrichiaceae bacterium]
MCEFNENLFEKMLDDYLPEEKKTGDVIEGIITRKEVDYSYLDLNGKKEGRIISREVEDFNIGDRIEVKVLRNEEDIVIVSKFLLDKSKEFFSLSVDEIVTGKIVKKIKGGYSVKIGKNDGFLPFSLSNFQKDKEYEGEKFKFIVKEKNKSSITLSRTDLVRKEEEEFFNVINVGDVVVGKVKSVLDFGLVLDLEATTGFIHVSEISWEQVDDLIEKFGINDEVTAKIIEKDTEKRKLKLSIKQLSEDPWNSFIDTYNIGDVIDIIVKDVLDFGLVIGVQKNKGFIHISELAWNNSAKEIKKYKKDDKLEAKIISIENDKKNIKLSIKQLSENPWNSVKEKYKIGEILERNIIEIFEFGLLVELEKNIEGLLHISDLSYRRISNLNSKYKLGDKIKFKIIKFNDEKNRISLSSKALIDDVWNKIDEIYSLGDVVSGTVTNIQEYGIFVELPEGIEVFIHKNEFSWDKEEVKECRVGNNIEFKIINLEKEAKKMGGSIKQLTISPWKEAYEQYKIGNKLSVPIVLVQENFVLVKLTDRFDGVIPKKELTEEYLKDIDEKFKVGDVVEAVIIEMNEKRKSIVLSSKKVKEMEETKELEELMKIYGV